MKHLSFFIIITILIISCNKKNENEDSDLIPEFNAQIIDHWTDQNNYKEYKYRDQELKIEEFGEIIYQLNEDGSYLVENELEFGVPNGSGNWVYYKDFGIIEFRPSENISYDTSLHFFWKDFDFDGDKMSVNYYRTTKPFTPEGTIKTNRIPRYFEK